MPHRRLEAAGTAAAHGSRRAHPEHPDGGSRSVDLPAGIGSLRDRPARVAGSGRSAFVVHRVDPPRWRPSRSGALRGERAGALRTHSRRSGAGACAVGIVARSPVGRGQPRSGPVPLPPLLGGCRTVPLRRRARGSGCARPAIPPARRTQHASHRLPALLCRVQAGTVG